MIIQISIDVFIADDLVARIDASLKKKHIEQMVTKINKITTSFFNICFYIHWIAIITLKCLDQYIYIFSQATLT